MQNKQKLIKPISAMLLLACGTLSQQAQAALPANAVLNFTSGVGSCQAGGTYPACNYGATTVLTGSYFAMDLNTPIGVFAEEERTLIETAGTGVTLDTAQVAGAIDLDWSFGGNLGRHLTLNALAYTSTGSNTYNINMAGWTVNWGTEGNIDMGAGAAAVLTCAVDCTIGDTFTLDYTAVVPTGSFSGINYQLYLEGTIGVDNTAPVSNNVNISRLPAASHTWTPDVSDADMNTLTCNIETQGSSGTAAVLSDCSSGTYTPASGAGFTGADSFTYSSNDGFVDSNPHGIVSVTVLADPPPSCQNLPALPGSTTAAGVATNVTIDVTTVCTDAAGSIVASTLAVSSTSTNNGNVSVDPGTGIVTYTPAFGFAGTDTFTYTVQDDNAGTSTPATVTMTVETNSAGSPTSPDGTLACGTTANSAGSTSCVVTMENIGVNDNGFSRAQGIAQSCVGGCFDFTVSGLTAGSEARIILPLSTAIPAAVADDAGHKIVYRKLMPSGWQDFDTSDNNAIASAAGSPSGADIICPPAGNASYISGLTTGDRCIQLTITDGGPNDADGTANGTVVDPGGVSETFFTSGTDGCSMSKTSVNARERADWWLVAGFLGLLGLFRLTRNKA
ncbi:MAG: Ig-like domain-containing protein [Gammaproteobacteria bacterium]|nr:Ig-like domain-containing protein [Gammaproteobacteria bacterium]